MLDGFKKIVKMKIGGSVSKAIAKCSGGKMKKGGEVDAADIKQDKAIVKKAFSMHDKQEHGGEKTDLSKLKRGGRSKKEAGTVRKFKTGGSVTNVYEAKKSSGDIDNIKKTKLIKPAKAAAPSKAAVKGKGLDAYKRGGKVKKMADGSLTGALAGGALGGGLAGMVQDQERKKRMAKYLGPAQQAQLAAQQAQATNQYGPGTQAAAQVQPGGGTSPVGAVPMQKRGGKVKDKC